MRDISAVLLEVLRAKLWVVPSIAALVAAVLALVVVQLDRASGSLGLPLTIGADSARAVLSAISGAMISFTALVFSITMLVLQAVSTQLSPRVVRTFLRDRFNQVVLGLFVATFVFSLLVLSAIGSQGVPTLGVVVAVGLVLVSVMAFVAYIDHMAHDIQPTSVIESIAVETISVIERVYPDTATPATGGGPPRDRLGEGLVVTWSGAAGYVQAYDRDGLLAFAQDQGSAVELQVGTGDFLVSGQPWLVVPGRPSGTSEAAAWDLADHVQLGPERTMTEDPEFGFRQLVDVALRALSPSLNDASTAAQVIDRLHELLGALEPRDIPSPLVWQEGSAPPVIVPAPDWDTYVHLATSEIGEASRTLPRVRRHLHGVLGSLLDVAAPERRPALRRAQAEFEELDPSGVDR
jgi:uncharacterized membrane protein